MSTLLLLLQVRREVGQLRVILEGIEAKERERVWLKAQSHGELDDNRLVDGATGERNIFKRRGVPVAPMAGSAQRLPKRLRFVMDVSSSMGRFNGSDRRLDRMAATTVMVMEAFAGLEHKYSYSIAGHSGESHCVLFVDDRLGGGSAAGGGGTSVAAGGGLLGTLPSRATGRGGGGEDDDGGEGVAAEEEMYWHGVPRNRKERLEVCVNERGSRGSSCLLG